MSIARMPLTYHVPLVTWHMDESASERVITPMPKFLLAAIDDYRFARRMPSRAEAIRRLIEAGLKAGPEGAFPRGAEPMQPPARKPR